MLKPYSVVPLGDTIYGTYGKAISGILEGHPAQTIVGAFKENIEFATARDLAPVRGDDLHALRLPFGCLHDCSVEIAIVVSDMCC